MKRSNPSDLSALLRFHRTSSGRSLREIAEICHIGRSTLSRWERGEGQPGHRELYAIIEALELDDARRSAFLPFLEEPKPVDPHHLARRRLLKAARIRAGLNLSDAAARVGVTKAALSRWETGHRSPSFQTFATAIASLGATQAEITAIGSPVLGLLPTRVSLDILHDRVGKLRTSIQENGSRSGELEFIELDAAISRSDSSEAKRLRLELRAAYVEWLGWWYRDAESGAQAAKLLPFLRKDQTSLVWGRLLRACSNYTTEFRHDPEGAIELLEEACQSLIGGKCEGFVRRELAGLYSTIGDRCTARRQLLAAREAGAGEEDASIHTYCCSMIEAGLWSVEGDHDRAIQCLPDWTVRDPYLASSSAIGRSRILSRAGLRDAARSVAEGAMQRTDAHGLHHFSRGLGKHLRREFSVDLH